MHKDSCEEVAKMCYYELLYKLVSYTQNLSLSIYIYSVGGGALLFVVGGAIRLVDSDNEHDSIMLNS